jgi:UDP-N-acetylmuramoylalanine--D-glutamate ligase
MKILLLGLGRANLSVARYCLERGDSVALYEEHIDTLSDDARALLDKGALSIHRGGEYDLIVSSPGFPMQKDIIGEYEARGTMIIDEIEFTYQQLVNPSIIAVTGTNGKSTTAALIHTIITAAGQDCFLGGNLAPGKPFSKALFEPSHLHYVLEVSSFQLMRIKKFHPRVAVMTNISIDHLNWHATVDEYRQAKLALFMNQTPEDCAVLNHDDEEVMALTREINAQRIYFGRSADNGAHCNGSFRFKTEALFPCTITGLLGEHNIMNTLAAIAVGKALDIDTPSLQSGIASFTPLPHRLEDCGVYKGVRYINNSMCTNEQAAIASFKAVPGPKIVIVGGKEKGSQALKYLTLLASEAKACIIIGENAQAIEAFLLAHDYSTYAVVETMEQAIQAARSYATDGDTIILNPGFASFGLFKNFEERGEAFRHAVSKDR